MSKTSTALLLKFGMTFVAAALAFRLLGVIDATTPSSVFWMWIFIIALVGTTLNYLVGDLFVLPKFGNVVASIGDGVMAALVAVLVDFISTVFGTTLTSLILFGALVAVGEYFFHQYLKRSEKVEP